jgi:OmpA-OmpF porin, OOP family
MRNRPISHVALHAAALAALLAMSLAMLVTPVAQAQTAGTSDVISGKALTPDSVLDALDPQAVRTRSFKLGVARPKAQPARASASLLVTFETNSAELTAAARQQLDVVAAALKNDRLATYGFMVEGHADPRGESDANLLLSKERAESVKHYLITRHAIEPSRLTAEGRGDRELLNRDVPAAPENRRVTFVTRQP